MSVASRHARAPEWVLDMLGEKYVAARRASTISHDAPLPDDDSYNSNVSDSTNGPRAAVIPLPAPVWSGVAGLLALTSASAVNRIRKLV